MENQLGKQIQKHLYDRILENKQTNQLLLYVQQSKDNYWVASRQTQSRSVFDFVFLLGCQ